MKDKEIKKTFSALEAYKLKREHRKTVLILFLVGLLLETLLLGGMYTSKKEARMNETMAYGRAVATNIQLSLDKSISMTDMLKNSYLDTQDDFYPMFEQMGERLSEANPVIESIYWAPDAIVQYVYPLEYLADTAGFEMLKDPEQGESAQLAIDTKEITVAGPHDLVEGGVGFIIRNPVFDNGEFKGFSIIILDWTRFSNEIINNLADNAKNYHFAVWKENDAHAVVDKDGYILRSCNHDINREIVIPIKIPNDTWYLTVEPVAGFIRIWDMLPEIITSHLLLTLVVLAIYIKLHSSEKVLYAMEYDELTGLYTKQAFYRMARKMLDDNPNQEFDIVIADIENFKLVNGIHGEQKADEVLKYLADLFKEKNTQGICGRFSGDQFVCLGPTSEEGVGIEELTKIIAQTEPVPDLTIKYGVYQKVDRTLTIPVICDRALVALRSIKHNYEHNYAAYDGPVSKKELMARLFETSFNSAIKNNEFAVWFQPKFDTKTEELVGAEALVRWIKEDGTIISPGDFVPVFEEDGLIAELDEYVFRRVCEYIKGWQEQGMPMVPISVNLSRASLRKDGVVERYKEIAKSLGIPSDSVPIEITESAEYNNNNIADLAHGLKVEGFALYMDDFGAGFSSLSNLNTLPFDLVKLDKSLIDYIGDPGGKEIIRHTIELAHFKNMQVVAEGVETKEQLEELRRLDCDTIQGYYYSPPKPYAEFVKYLEAKLK